MFRSKFAEDVFNHKYKHTGAETWEKLTSALVEDVCNGLLTEDEKSELKRLSREMKFVFAGRFLYYSARPIHAWNNCVLVSAIEDTREDWADMSWKSERALMSGAGVGIHYGRYREEGRLLKRSGGYASGPIAKMKMINEIGRFVIQGGSRRSALWAGLNDDHPDIHKFIKAKDWHHMPVAGTNKTVADLKQADFNYPAPLDMTNISCTFGQRWLDHYNATGDYGDVFAEMCKQALSTGEPGASFDFNENANDVNRNPCCEVVSADDSDICCLSSINMGRIDSLEEMRTAVELGTKFLICATMRADLPYDKLYLIREKNRRIGLGLFGMHEWLIKRGHRYEINEPIREWLAVYRDVSDSTAVSFSEKMSVSCPVAKRSIAPTGSLSIISDTSGGCEPIFAVAYKRRYLKGKRWAMQYIIDATAQTMIDQYGVKPDSIESASDLAADYERRIKFQYDLQWYVDQAISSTLNLPKWGSELNNEDTVKPFAATLAKYAHGLRGFTAYPDSARGGQPAIPCSYETAVKHIGEEFIEDGTEVNEICSISGHGGHCAS